MKLLERMVALQKEFTDLYTQGLTGVGIMGCLVMPDFFFKSFPEYLTTPRKCDTYPWEHYTIWNGTKFFCITKEVKDASPILQDK